MCVYTHEYLIVAGNALSKPGGAVGLLGIFSLADTPFSVQLLSHVLDR